MAKRPKKPSKPVNVVAEAEKIAKQRAAERSYLRDQGIDPAIHDWGNEAVEKDRIAALTAKGVDVELDARGRMKSANKADVFAYLHARGPKTFSDAQLAAVRELESDMIRRAGFGSAFNTEKVDRQGEAAGMADAMAEAGARVEDVLALVGLPSSKILRALVGPDSEADGRRLVRRCLAVVSAPEDNDEKRRLTCDAPNVVGATKCAACSAKMPGGAVGIETVADQEGWRDVIERVIGEVNPQAQVAVLRLAAQSLADAYTEVDRRAVMRFNARKDRLEAAGNGHMRANAA